MVGIISRDALPVNALFRRELAAILIGGDAILKVVLVLIPAKRKHTQIMGNKVYTELAAP
jgi:hypothetical protein